LLNNNRTVFHILTSQASCDEQPLNMDRILRCVSFPLEQCCVPDWLLFEIKPFSLYGV